METTARQGRWHKGSYSYMVMIGTVAIMLAGCAPNLAKRQRGLAHTRWMNSCVVDRYVKVDLVSTQKHTETTAALTLAQLPEKAQKELVRSLALKTKNADTLGVILATDIKKKPKETLPYAVIGVTVDRRLILRVDKVWAAQKLAGAVVPAGCDPIVNNTTYFNDPGDRIMNLEVDLKLDANAPFEIANWDAFKSQYLTVDLGTVSSKLNMSLAAEVAATATGSASTSSAGNRHTLLPANEAGEGGGENTATTGGTNETGFSYGPKASASLASEYLTSQTLSNQYLRFNGLLKPDGFNIRQDGAPGSDLSGNSEIGITLRYTGTAWDSRSFHRFKGLFKNGLPEPWAATMVSKQDVLYPAISTDLKAMVEFSFLFRDVEKGRRHIPEARQKVTHAYGKAPATQHTILRAIDLKPKGYRLVAGGNAVMLSGVEVVLADAETAAQLLAWLRQVSAIPNVFTLGGTAVAPAGLGIMEY